MVFDTRWAGAWSPVLLCPAVAFSRLSFLPLGRVVIKVMTKTVTANIYGGLTHT